VVCGQPGQDAHHIMERRLFPDGGYYSENGATLCGKCHLAAEATDLATDEIRAVAGIKNTILPPHLYPDQPYDKWGNPVLTNGLRLKGELYDDESVQKVLEPVRHLFLNRVKYPRTWHFPWSPGMKEDDRELSEEILDTWNGTEVVVTEKMDGENTTMYRDYMHARSLDYEAHSSRDRVKALHASIAHDIPNNWRICGENLTAKHSIYYSNLPSFFLVFSIWDGLTCLPWKDTVDYAGLLGLQTVPVRWYGKKWEDFSPEILEQYSLNSDKWEGYVVRPAGSFHLKEFSTRVGKYVRKDHVQTHGHWMRSRIEWNHWDE
jgi:hypothetical protein